MKLEQYGMVNGEIEIEMTETCYYINYNYQTKLFSLFILFFIRYLLFVNDVN